MLTHISIENFITITKSHVDLCEGLTCITGDTGAGKSLLIQAIHFALGSKMSQSKTIQQPTRVSLVFDLEHLPQVSAQLASENILIEETQCIITRILNTRNKSRYTINNTPCTRTVVQQIGAELLHVHGQHATFALLKKDHQRDFLDQLIKPQLKTQTQQAYRQWQTNKKKLQALQDSEQQNQSRQELLTYQLDELSQVNCSQTHTETIENELKQMNQAETILDTCQLVCDQIKNEPHTAVLPQIAQLLKNTQAITNTVSQAKNAESILYQVEALLNEAYDELNSIASQTQHNPSHLQQLNDQISQ